MKNHPSQGNVVEETITQRRMAGPNVSTSRPNIRVQILDVLKRRSSFEMEELVDLCHSFTWNQIFLEVDRLSRTGEVRLVPRGAGVYAVTLPQQRASIS
jgi:hypothetical protein